MRRPSDTPVMDRLARERREPGSTHKKREQKVAACGTVSAYNSGCRCDDCRGAIREAQRAYRKRVKAEQAAAR